MSVPFNYECTLSDELLQRAENELGERSQWRDRDVQALQQMVNESPDLSCPVDYEFMLRFLRAKKFDYERAFSSLRRYYDIRTRHSEIFSDFMPSSVEDVYKLGIVAVLPRRDIKGRRILLLKPGLWDPDQLPSVNIFKAVVLCVEWLICDEETQINGIVLLYDVAGVGWKHLKFMTRDRIKLYTYVIQEAFPVRLKGIHILNSHALVQHVLSLFRLFLKEKLKERIHIYGQHFQGLIEDVGADCLPLEYSGKFCFAPTYWPNEILADEVEAYFKTRLNDGYVNQAKKQAARRQSSGSIATFGGNSPLLKESDYIKSADLAENSIAFTSFTVCHASVDSD